MPGDRRFVKWRREKINDGIKETPVKDHRRYEPGKEYGMKNRIYTMCNGNDIVNDLKEIPPNRKTGKTKFTGCNTCHPGNHISDVGSAGKDAEEAIDCLVCHSSVYDYRLRKAFKDETGRVVMGQDRSVKAATAVTDWRSIHITSAGLFAGASIATHVGLYIIDVMGHGLAATSTTLLLSRLLNPKRVRANRLAILDADPRSPKRVVERLNELFYDSRDQMFFTICYAVIDLEEQKLTMVRAGHPYPILQKADGSLQDVRVGGFAVGITQNLGAPEFETILEPGDKLFLYSDGLTDCTDFRTMQYSRERLVFNIEESRKEDVAYAVSRIKSDVIAWRGRQSFDDDISLIAVQFGD